MAEESPSPNKQDAKVETQDKQEKKERPQEKQSKKEQRKRKKQAKKALLSFLKRLRGLCNKFDSVNKWLERVEKLNTILDEYDDVFDKEDRKRLKKAAEIQDATRAGISAACKVLTFEIEKTLAGMAVGLTFSSVVITVFIATAVIVGVVVGISKIPVSIHIHNRGCSDIPLGEALPPTVRVLFKTTVGDIPDSIDMDQEETLQAPRLPLKITLEMVSANDLRLDLGLFSLPINTNAESVQFDGEEVLDGPVTKRLTEQSEHTLIIICP